MTKFCLTGYFGFIVMGQNCPPLGCIWEQGCSGNFSTFTWCSYFGLSAWWKTDSMQHIRWPDPFLGSSWGLVDVYNWGSQGYFWGRLMTDRRSAANTSIGKYFTTLCYSADGSYILAGGNSKYICMYDVGEQVRKSFFDNYQLIAWVPHFFLGLCLLSTVCGADLLLVATQCSLSLNLLVW